MADLNCLVGKLVLLVLYYLQTHFTLYVVDCRPCLIWCWTFKPCETWVLYFPTLQKLGNVPQRPFRTWDKFQKALDVIHTEQPSGCLAFAGNSATIVRRRASDIP